MEMQERESLELSVVMPCRNEEVTVAFCVKEAKEFIENYHIEAEVLVVDNASEDASAVMATQQGAKVVTANKIGYGNAVRAGIASSKGRVIIIGDCDTTYDFGHLEDMYRLLSQNVCDMVIGNRYTGGMESGSMPWSHKWGVRFLSFLAGKRFHTQRFDYHCGLRGLTRSAAEQLEFRTEGMEFATEMIAEAAKHKLCIMQVPVKLRCCRYRRQSKLRTIQDGFRHLMYIKRKGEDEE